jgi:hypothetical protein
VAVWSVVGFRATDVMEILEASPETTCIVLTMTCNQRTPEAGQYCREPDVGL